MNNVIVPFGKYKGQPIEILAADKEYCDWLITQSWFVDRYSNVYNIVVNYGAEQQDSPEHNQMQAKFLDDEWCIKSINSLTYYDEITEPTVSCKVFEWRGWDCKYYVNDLTVFVELKPDLGDDYPAVLRQVKNYPIWRNDDEKYYGIGEHCKLVIVRRHSFQYVTWDDVRQIFAASSIVLIEEDSIAKRISDDKSVW